jgi:hypothetical protein
VTAGNVSHTGVGLACAALLVVVGALVAILSGGSCASSTSSSRPTVKTGRSTGSFTLTANGGSLHPRPPAMTPTQKPFVA